MIPSDRKPFMALIADVYSFYRKDFSPFAGNVWWEAMKPYDFKAVGDAFNRHCVNPDNGQFMPFPADIVKMLAGSTQDAAFVAWAKVDGSIRRVGTYRSVVFDDPLIHRVLSEMGGWVHIGGKDEKEWPFLKNEFVTRYRGYRGRSEVPDYLPVMVGIAEATNSKAGFMVEPPLMIGDPAQARKVMQLGSTKPILQIGQMDARSAVRAIDMVDSRSLAEVRQ